MWLTTRSGTAHHAWRFHTQFHLDRHVPQGMDLTAGKNSGESDEKTVLRQHLAADHIYVMDRWYAQFKLFDDIVTARAATTFAACATTARMRLLLDPPDVATSHLATSWLAARVLVRMACGRTWANSAAGRIFEFVAAV